MIVDMFGCEVHYFDPRLDKMVVDIFGCDVHYFDPR